MFTVESLLYRKLGIRKEFPELNPIAITLIMTAAAKYTNDHQVIFDGYPLPKIGPAFITGNHFAESDIYKATEAGRRARRVIRPMARRSLIMRGEEAIESKAYLESIGAEDDYSEQFSLIRALLLKDVVIDVRRDLHEMRVGRRANAVIRSGQLLGVFFQPHRYEDCILRNLETGPATLAKLNPEVPIYIMAFSGPPHGPDKVTTLKPFTYEEKETELGREISPEELTIIMADIAVTELPKSSQKDWETRREVELTRLTSKK